MTRQITAQPLTPERFAPFGDVIEASGEPSMMINNGMCGRYHDLAQLDFHAQGRAGISIFEGKPYSLPHSLTLLERHPRGSQAFLPMANRQPYLVIVAADRSGVPATPIALIASPRQGVNIHRGVWHGVLTPLQETACFAVVDWIGSADNLEEHTLAEPWLVVGE